MTEYAHSRTGIDINSGAEIGEYFFIDHGTGVVIGETTEIGNNVKLYQGVTLGGNNGKERELENGEMLYQPLLKDGVKIYTNASVFGPVIVSENTIIKAGSIISHDL